MAETIMENMLKNWAKTYFLNKDLLRGKKPKLQ